MANRFSDILKATQEPTKPALEPTEVSDSTPKAPSGKVPGWEPKANDDEVVERLNVEIPRSLHQKLKAKSLELNKTKKDLVISLLQWALDDDSA